MDLRSFETFFLATAGTGGAFVGLLFIAISIGPQRTFDPHAVAGVPHRRLPRRHVRLCSMASWY